LVRLDPPLVELFEPLAMAGLEAQQISLNFVDR
jgi:hypothetical protein